MIGSLIMESDVTQDRKRERLRRLLKARMVHPRHGEIDILVRDVSEHGVGGKCAHDVKIGEIVTIHLPASHAAQGRVAWRRGEGFGVELTGPIEPGAVKPPADQAANMSYLVPDRFKPSDSIKRPGFGRRSKR